MKDARGGTHSLAEAGQPLPARPGLIELISSSRIARDGEVPFIHRPHTTPLAEQEGRKTHERSLPLWSSPLRVVRFPGDWRMSLWFLPTLERGPHACRSLRPSRCV